MSIQIASLNTVSELFTDDELSYEIVVGSAYFEVVEVAGEDEPVQLLTAIHAKTGKPISIRAGSVAVVVH